jgi:hypothetical protein
MRRVAVAALALASWLAGVEGQDAEPEPSPDLDFFEYLGAWAEDDDEWLASEEWQNGEPAEPDEDPEGSGSEREDGDEDDDESE